VIALLREKQAVVKYHDPYISQISHDDWTMQSEEELMTAVKEADCVVIITNHSSYDFQAIHDGARMIVDTRHALGELEYDRGKVEML
jgi:UDP-N-acetyl-D-glucosamine dehydrogenase